MKKLMIAAGFGMVFTILSVMPAKAASPRDNGYRDGRRIEYREYRRVPERRVERFDRHQDFHRDFRPQYRHCR